MNSDSFRQAAAQEGFEGVYVLAPMIARRTQLNRHTAGLSDDPHELLPGVRSVILLLMPWKPFIETEKAELECEISPYYLSSQRAYLAAKRLAEQLKSEGFQALSNAQLAIKVLMQKAGIGKPGRNSLISVPGFGTRFHAQVILTDADFEKDAERKPLEGMDDMCLNCAKCVSACPSRAILPGGGVDAEKCLRSKDEGEIAPEWMRSLFENRLFGCDICQNVCPRNRQAGLQPVPEDMKEDLRLKKLLNGNLGALSALIGRNYARKARIRMKAALVAGNRNRRDCLEELKQLSLSDHEGERTYAQWALLQIEGETK